MTAEEKATRLYMKELAILETAAASKYGDPKNLVPFVMATACPVSTRRVAQWAAAGVKRIETFSRPYMRRHVRSVCKGNEDRIYSLDRL